MKENQALKEFEPIGKYIQSHSRDATESKHFTKKVHFNKPLKSIKILDQGRHRVFFKDYERAKEEAFEQGRASVKSAYEEALKEAQAKFQEVRDNLFKSIESEFEGWTQSIRDRIPDLITQITHRVIGEIELDASRLKAIVEETLNEIGSSADTLEVYLSTRDCAILKGIEETLIEKYGKLRILEDKQLNSGDCCVISQFGMIDARLSSKLKKIQEEFVEA